MWIIELSVVSGELKSKFNNAENRYFQPAAQLSQKKRKNNSQAESKDTLVTVTTEVNQISATV